MDKDAHAGAGAGASFERQSLEYRVVELLEDGPRTRDQLVASVAAGARGIPLVLHDLRVRSILAHMYKNGIVARTRWTAEARHPAVFALVALGHSTTSTTSNTHQHSHTKDSDDTPAEDVDEGAGGSGDRADASAARPSRRIRDDLSICGGDTGASEFAALSATAAAAAASVSRQHGRAGDTRVGSDGAAASAPMASTSHVFGDDTPAMLRAAKRARTRYDDNCFGAAGTGEEPHKSRARVMDALAMHQQMANAAVDEAAKRAREHPAIAETLKRSHDAALEALERNMEERRNCAGEIRALADERRVLRAKDAALASQTDELREAVARSAERSEIAEGMPRVLRRTHERAQSEAHRVRADTVKFVLENFA